MNMRESIVRWLGLGYDAAAKTRNVPSLRAGRKQAKSEDALIGPRDRLQLRQICLDLRRNNAIVAATCQRLADNVVGSEIIPQAQTSSGDWNSAAERYWHEWSKIADYRQRLTLGELTRLLVEGRLTTGDLGFVLTSGGQLQPIEGERINTPKELESKGNIVDGVEINEATGIATGYYIFRREKDGTIKTEGKAWERVDRENFIYVGTPAIRPDQVRGIPELAPVVLMLRHHDALTDATLQKAKLDAMHAWAITLEGAGGPGALGPRLGQQSAVGSPQFEKFEAGQNYYLRTGEKIESLASNTPNREYESFTRNTLRLIGAAIGMPYEFMVMDFSTGSYASQRMALLQTHKRLRSYQMWLTRRFLQRVWNWQIAKAIKTGKLAQAPADPTGVSEWYKVDWIYPEFGWADPHREAQKALLEYRMGTNTFSMMAKERGRDPEELLSEKGRDIAKAHAVAQEVNKETGLALTWKDFIEGGGAPGTAATNNGAVEGERRISAPLENE